MFYYHFNIHSFHDALLTPKEEQIEYTATLRTAPSELSSEGGETFQCINNSDDESKTFDQLNRNENDYGHGGDTGIRDILWSKDEHNTDNECNMGNNTLSEECGKFIVDNVPSFIIPTPLTGINDSGNSSSDSVSELGSDMPMNNSRRHIALEPRSMTRYEGGGKVTFDSKVSIVEYDQRLSLSTSAGWSKLFM